MTSQTKKNLDRLVNLENAEEWAADDVPFRWATHLLEDEGLCPRDDHDYLTDEADENLTYLEEEFIGVLDSTGVPWKFK